MCQVIQHDFVSVLTPSGSILNTAIAADLKVRYTVTEKLPNGHGFPSWNSKKILCCAILKNANPEPFCHRTKQAGT